MVYTKPLGATPTPAKFGPVDHDHFLRLLGAIPLERFRPVVEAYPFIITGDPPTDEDLAEEAKFLHYALIAQWRSLICEQMAFAGTETLELDPETLLPVGVDPELLSEVTETLLTNVAVVAETLPAMWRTLATTMREVFPGEVDLWEGVVLSGSYVFSRR